MVLKVSKYFALKVGAFFFTEISTHSMSFRKFFRPRGRVSEICRSLTYLLQNPRRSGDKN